MKKCALWGPLFVEAPVRPNMPNMPKSAFDWTDSDDHDSKYRVSWWERNIIHENVQKSVAGARWSSWWRMTVDCTSIETVIGVLQKTVTLKPLLSQSYSYWWRRSLAFAELLLKIQCELKWRLKLTKFSQQRVRKRVRDQTELNPNPTTAEPEPNPK